MANRSGLIALVSSVRDYFEENEVDAVVAVVGWRERTKLTNYGTAGRVVFELAPEGGKMVSPREPGPRGAYELGSVRRTLLDWERAIPVYMWARDAAKPDDQEAQIEAVESLFEWVLRATFDFGTDTVWGATKWPAGPVENLFGLELRADLTLRHPMFDLDEELAFAGQTLERTFVTG